MARAMTEFEEVMINRDEMSASQAGKTRDKARSALYDILENGGGYDDVESMMYDEYGLEMDYIFDLL
mgnify:CR=1 FL=1